MADNSNNNTYTIKLKGAAIEQRLDDVTKKLNRENGEAYNLKIKQMAATDDAASTKQYVDNKVTGWSFLNTSVKTLKVGDKTINYLDTTFYNKPGGILFADKDTCAPTIREIGANGKVLKVEENEPRWLDETALTIATPRVISNGNAITSLEVSGHTITPVLDTQFATRAYTDTEFPKYLLKTAYTASGDILLGTGLGEYSVLGVSGNDNKLLMVDGTTHLPAWKEESSLTSVLFKNAYTASGDILVGTGNATASALGIGEPGQILMVNADTEPVWQSESALTSVLFKNDYTEKGDILVGTDDADNPALKLSIGNEGQILKVNDGTAIWADEPVLSVAASAGAGNAITSLSVSGHTITPALNKTFIETSAYTAKGDLLVGTGNAAASKLAKGTSGQILKSSNSGLAWGDETSLSLITAGSGNAITGLSVDGHAITITKGDTFLTNSDRTAIENQIGDKLTIEYNSSSKTITISKYSKN